MSAVLCSGDLLKACETIFIVLTSIGEFSFWKIRFWSALTFSSVIPEGSVRQVSETVWWARFSPKSTLLGWRCRYALEVIEGFQHLYPNCVCKYSLNLWFVLGSFNKTLFVLGRASALAACFCRNWSFSDPEQEHFSYWSSYVLSPADQGVCGGKRAVVATSSRSLEVRCLDLRWLATSDWLDSINWNDVVAIDGCICASYAYVSCCTSWWAQSDPRQRRVRRTQLLFD